MNKGYEVFILNKEKCFHFIIKKHEHFTSVNSLLKNKLVVGAAVILGFLVIKGVVYIYKKYIRKPPLIDEPPC
jgi:hypothetical protein